MAKQTIGDVLRARGLTEGTPEWTKAAMEILAGKGEWARLKKLSPEEVARELAQRAPGTTLGHRGAEPRCESALGRPVIEWV